MTEYYMNLPILPKIDFTDV